MKTQLIEKLKSFCNEFKATEGITFDGPETCNFRKVRGKDAYHIYLRSFKGSNLFMECYSHGNTKPLFDALNKHGLSVVKFHGGCADMGASFELGLLS